MKCNALSATEALSPKVDVKFRCTCNFSCSAHITKEKAAKTEKLKFAFMMFDQVLDQGQLIAFMPEFLKVTSTESFVGIENGDAFPVRVKKCAVACGVRKG